MQHFYPQTEPHTIIAHSRHNQQNFKKLATNIKCAKIRIKICQNYYLLSFSHIDQYLYFYNRPIKKLKNFTFLRKKIGKKRLFYNFDFVLQS